MAYGADFSVSAIQTETKAVVGEDALFFPSHPSRFSASSGGWR